MPTSTDSFAARLSAEPPRPADRLRLTATGLRDELGGSRRLTADARSFARFASDALGYRTQRVLKFGAGGRRRTVAFTDGTVLSYRANRGDVRAIAETWIARAYELPFDLQPHNLVDLGANIGAAGVWLLRRYGGAKLVAVEPVPENAELARVNLARTGVDFEVIQAAIGPASGVARFEVSETSTLGHVGESGIEVAVVSPRVVIDRFPPGELIDLMKMDVEGAEQELFAADLDWLDRVGCLVLELHGDRVDWWEIIAALEDRGFRHYPIAAGNHYCGPTDLMAAFQRSV